MSTDFPEFDRPPLYDKMGEKPKGGVPMSVWIERIGLFLIACLGVVTLCGAVMFVNGVYRDVENERKNEEIRVKYWKH